MTQRDLQKTSYESNPLLHWPEQASKLSTFRNVLFLGVSKILPLRLKNSLLRLLGVKIGEDTAIGLSVQLDVFFPEKISIGDSSVIGYGTTIIAHETTTEEFRKGKTIIGDDVLVGANSTVLAGVEIKDGAKVGAGSVVVEDVPEDVFVAGVPAKPVE